MSSNFRFAVTSFFSAAFRQAWIADDGQCGVDLVVEYIYHRKRQAIGVREGRVLRDKASEHQKTSTMEVRRLVAPDNQEINQITKRPIPADVEFVWLPVVNFGITRMEHKLDNRLEVIKPNFPSHDRADPPDSRDSLVLDHVPQAQTNRIARSPPLSPKVAYP